MRALAAKKVVFVIVEGPSDETALGIGLSQVYDKDRVHIHIQHGDITTAKGAQPDNIVRKVANEIKSYADRQHFKKSDFKEIVHITDTDGVYIPDDHIFEDANAKTPVYDQNGIYTSNKEGIIKRNLQKRENLYTLRSTPRIWTVPYRIFYMSCNLEHVLYGKLNCTDAEKERLAYEFAQKYKDDRTGFIQYMCRSDFSVNESYAQTWKYVESGLRSLSRKSNLCICIEKELEERKHNI